MIRINLLPREQLRRPGIPPRTLVLLLVAVVAAAAVMTTILFNARNARVRAEIARTDERIVALKPQVERVEALRTQIEAAKRKQQLLARLEAGRLPWAIILEDVRTVMPKDVWLTQMAAGEDGSVNILGFGLSYTAVARFMVNLESSPMFSDIDMVVSQKQPYGGREVVNFSLTGRLTVQRKEAVLR